MRNIVKSTAALFFALILSACATTQQEVTYVKVGKVESVHLVEKTKKPSLVEVGLGATLGGLLGNQVGGGSAKYWTTSLGALAGGATVHKALSEKYKEIQYHIYYPETRTKEVLSSKDLSPTIFKNDLVVIEKTGKDFQMDAYGKYTPENFKILVQKLDNGEL